ncbi:DUF1330 domain-containing protein, partial [Akkermansiaceae bacterium]|nr:DUF1330 domain-containing protein [Akkermansiaceae bacterium]
MTYYSVIEVTPTTEDWIPAYLEPVQALVTKHGGKYIARTATHEILEGDREKPALRILIEWTTEEGAKAFMADPEYAPHLKARKN